MSISSHSSTPVTDPARNSVPTSFGPAIRDELEFLGFLTSDQRSRLPDWLVIGPPKTGTSWLYANLREHPAAYAPAIKELKYFSHRFQTEDLRAYLEHFRDGIGKAKGEASPSYSMLPRRTIWLMRRLMPNLKLIYLMRDPIERAWSHARHSFCQGEANFKGCRGMIDEVTDDEWIVNLDDEWNRLSGDYLGQLQRWSSVFPREQIYVGFFEDLAAAPRKLFRDVLEFLQLDPDFADSSSVTLDAVNVGTPRTASPRLRRHLQALYSKRTAELATYLERKFQLRLPAAWEESPGNVIDPGQPSAAPDRAQDQPPADPQHLDWETDDDTLARLLARDDLLAMDFLGFNIVRRGTAFMAYRSTLDVTRRDDVEWWHDQTAEGNCFVADNPYDLKSMIVRDALSREMPPGSDQPRLRQIELEFDRLFRRQAELEGQLTDLKQVVAHGLKPLDVLSAQQAAMKTHLSEFKQVVARGLAPLDHLFLRQAEMEGDLREFQHDVARGLAPVAPIQASQAQLDRELARCRNQLNEFQIQLRVARRRLRKLSKNRIIRALRWLDVCLPWRRGRTAAVSPGGVFSQVVKPQTLGQIEVRPESDRFADGLAEKSLLPCPNRSVISLADRRMPTA